MKVVAAAAAAEVIAIEAAGAAAPSRSPSSLAEIASGLGLSLSSITFPVNIVREATNKPVGRAHTMWGTTLKLTCRNKEHGNCSMMLRHDWFGGVLETVQVGFQWLAEADAVDEGVHFARSRAIVARGVAMKHCGIASASTAM